MKQIICASVMAGFLASCAHQAPVWKPVGSVVIPAKKSDISKPVDNVGNEVTKVDVNSRELQAKIDALKATARNSKDALEKTGAKVALLQKQGSANKLELEEVRVLVQEVRAKNLALDADVEAARGTMDAQRLAITKLNDTVLEARKAAADKDIEVSNLRNSLMDADVKLKEAGETQAQMAQTVRDKDAELTATKAKLSNAMVYKWWVIGIVVVVVLGFIGKIALTFWKPPLL